MVALPSYFVCVQCDRCDGWKCTQTYMWGHQRGAKLAKGCAAIGEDTPGCKAHEGQSTPHSPHPLCSWEQDSTPLHPLFFPVPHLPWGYPMAPVMAPPTICLGAVVALSHGTREVACGTPLPLCCVGIVWVIVWDGIGSIVGHWPSSAAGKDYDPMAFILLNYMWRHPMSLGLESLQWAVCLQFYGMGSVSMAKDDPLCCDS